MESSGEVKWYCDFGQVKHYWDCLVSGSVKRKIFYT